MSQPPNKYHHCDKVGHKPEVCRYKHGIPESTKTDAIARTMRISSSNPCDKFVKEVNVGNESVEAFVDLGSEVTLIRQSDLTKLGFIIIMTVSQRC